MDDKFLLGQHENAIQTVITRLDGVSERLDRIEVILAEKRGERRIGLWLVGAASSVVGALLPSAVTRLFGHH